MAIVNFGSDKFILRVWVLVLLCGILLLVLYNSHSAPKERNSLSIKDQYLQFENGNYILLYTPSMGKTKWQYVVGGAGINTLWLRLTEKEIDNPLMQADIMRFYYFLLNNSVSGHITSAQFTFKTFPLSIINFDNLVIETIPEIFGKYVQPAVLPSYHIIHDSSLDSRS